MAIDKSRIRQVLLECLTKAADEGDAQADAVIRSAMDELNAREEPGGERAVLGCWHDLAQGGYVAWGRNYDEPGYPHCFLTDKGSRAQAAGVRDPSNPEGYMAYLRESAALTPTAESYIREALEAYGGGCEKSAAVMVACAAEAMVLELGNQIYTLMMYAGKKPGDDLRDLRVSTVRDAVHKHLRTMELDTGLRQEIEKHWPALTRQIAHARNDAGHPASLDRLIPDDVHYALTTFTSVAALTKSLLEWLSKKYG